MENSIVANWLAEQQT